MIRARRCSFPALAAGLLFIGCNDSSITSNDSIAYAKAGDTAPKKVSFPASEFATLQDAVNVVADGGTISIGPGAHKSSVDIVNKSVKLVGDKDGTTLVAADPAKAIVQFGKGGDGELRGIVFQDGRVAFGGNSSFDARGIVFEDGLVGIVFQDGVRIDALSVTAGGCGACTAPDHAPRHVNYPGPEFKTLQDAVDAVADGGRVLIGPGSHKAAVAIVGKSVKLVGDKDGTTLVAADPAKAIVQFGKDGGGELRGIVFQDGRVAFGGNSTFDARGIIINDGLVGIVFQDGVRFDALSVTAGGCGACK